MNGGHQVAGTGNLDWARVAYEGGPGQAFQAFSQADHECPIDLGIWSRWR